MTTFAARAPLTALLASFALLAAACDPVGTRIVHDVTLVDGAAIGGEGVAEGEEVRLRYVYGSADTVRLGGEDRTLGALVADDEATRDAPFAVAAARTVDDAAFLREARPAEPIEAAPATVARIPLTTDVDVRTAAAVETVAYFDGERWFAVADDVQADVARRVAPTPVAHPLRGAGALTPAEADAIAGGLAADGAPLVVTVVSPTAFEAAAGRPPAFGPSEPGGLDEYLHTLLVVQRDLATDASRYQPAEEARLYDVVAEGTQAAPVERDAYRLVEDRDALRSLWAELYAPSLDPPPTPDARFERETWFAVRLAPRPSSGYGVEIADVTQEGRDLFVDLRLVEPPEGAITSTVITHPWVLARVLGVEAEAVWFRDADAGDLIAVARSERAAF